MINIPTGALLDERLDEEKAKDYLHEEFAQGRDTVTWETKSSFKEYYPYNQSSSLSCVAAGGAITEEHFCSKRGANVVPSRKDIYIRRFNSPHGGMAMHDLFNICIKGMALELSVPSQGMGEQDMNTQYIVTPTITGERAKHNFKSWVSIQNFKDIDTLAQVVDHTPIVAFWFFDDKLQWQEWWKEYPQVVNKNCDLYGTATARHQAAIVDRTLINGKKYFVIQDSAGVGYGAGKNKNLRFVSEEFIKDRLYSAGYAIDQETVQTNKPKVKLTRTLKVGDKGDDVLQLQKVLIYEGLLKIATPTGLFAGMTRKAVIDYQNKYRSDILTPQGLRNGTGIVGRATINHINKIYG
jgi:hypothetical protein